MVTKTLFYMHAAVAVFLELNFNTSQGHPSEYFLENNVKTQSYTTTG